MSCFLCDLHTQISRGDYPCEHFFLQVKLPLRALLLILCSMTHYDITMGTDVTKDNHCYVTMSNDNVAAISGLKKGLFAKIK